MREWILTSSLLILAVLLIRAIGRDKLSARVRYALWALVLLRLLIPGSVGATSLSVLNYVPETDTVRELRHAPTYDIQQIQTSAPSDLPVVSDITDTSDVSVPSDTSQTTQTAQATRPSESTVQGKTTRQSERAANAPSILVMLWVVGMVLAGGVFVGSNLRFAAKLRRSRTYLLTETLPVYETAAIETPCLFGSLQPAVYVTPDVLADEDALRHVLAHELTHYRHKDHIWSLLRCVCVTLHWYNPLVWAAAYVSQQDAELACDEGALKRMGEDERTAYARTLLDLTCVGYKGMLTTATSMTGSDSDLKTRVLRIVKNPQMPKIAIPIVLVLALVIGLVVFTGEKKDPLEGIWVAEYEESYPAPGLKQQVYTELEFQDGIVRESFYYDGEFEYNREHLYRIEDDVVYFELTYSDRVVFQYRFELTDGKLTLYKENGLLYGEYVPYDRPSNVFLPEKIEHVTKIEMQHDGQALESVAGVFDYMGLRLLGILQGCEILESCAVSAIPYTEHIYTVVIESSTESKLLQIADGIIYMDGVAYEIKEKAALEELFLGMDWQPVGGYTDEKGQSYTEFPPYAEGIYLHLDMASGYGISRYYVPNNQGEWEAAVEELMENKAVSVGDETHLQEEEVYSLGVHNAQQISGSIQVQSNGVVLFWDSSETGEYTEYYACGEDVPKLMALAAPYFALAEQNFEEAKRDIGCDGAWVMNVPNGQVKYIRMTLDGSAKLMALSASMGSFSAQVGERVITSRFDYYIRDGLFHVRRKDLTEEVFPCTVEEGKMTITAYGRSWVFEPMTEENKPQIRQDILRSDNLALELSEETVAKLEALLRAGIGEKTDNIIFKNEHFYYLPALYEAFDSELVVLTDYGTFHYGSKAYKLTNREEVKAFLDTLYTEDNYTVKY